MRFDYYTQYRQGFALFKSPFERNLYALLFFFLISLPGFITPFALGEMAHVFILCIASLVWQSSTAIRCAIGIVDAGNVAGQRDIANVVKNPSSAR